MSKLIKKIIIISMICMLVLIVNMMFKISALNQRVNQLQQNDIDILTLIDSSTSIDIRTAKSLKRLVEIDKGQQIIIDSLKSK